jgi:hypothetical protein
MSDIRWTHRYVLREPEPRSAGEGVAKRLGWKRQKVTKSDHAKGVPFTITWRIPEEILCMYAEDSLSGEACVMWGGPDADAVTAVSSDALAHLHTWSRADLLAAFDAADSVPTRTRSVLRCGLGAPKEFDSQFADRVSSLLFDDDADLRAAAGLAISYTPWPEYRTPLEQAFTDEVDQETRATLGTVLEAMDELGIG